LVDRAEPPIDGLGVQPVERLLAVRPAGVALEEQPLERPDLGPAQVGPHRRHRLGRVVGKRGEHQLLATLDLRHDRHHQFVARTEVMDQHPVARAHRCGQITQRASADPTGGTGNDHRIEQVRATITTIARRPRHQFDAGAR
jgi:hypothetical protein